MEFIANNLNLVMGLTIIGLTGISYLLRNQRKYLPQVSLLVVASILRASSVFTRSMFDTFFGLIALILAVGSAALVAVLIRTPKTKVI
jgi:hypothetical protein